VSSKTPEKKWLRTQNITFETKKYGNTTSNIDNIYSVLGSQQLTPQVNGATNLTNSGNALLLCGSAHQLKSIFDRRQGGNQCGCEFAGHTSPVMVHQKLQSFWSFFSGWGSNPLTPWVSLRDETPLAVPCGPLGGRTDQQVGPLAPGAWDHDPDQAFFLGHWGIQAAPWAVGPSPPPARTGPRTPQ